MFMNFIIKLPILTIPILVIINKFTEIVYHKLMKIIIDTLGLVKVIIYILIQHHNLPNLIINN